MLIVDATSRRVGKAWPHLRGSISYDMSGHPRETACTTRRHWYYYGMGAVSQCWPLLLNRQIDALTTQVPPVNSADVHRKYDILSTIAIWPRGFFAMRPCPHIYTLFPDVLTPDSLASQAFPIFGDTPRVSPSVAWPPRACLPPRTADKRKDGTQFTGFAHWFARMWDSIFSTKRVLVDEYTQKKNYTQMTPGRKDWTFYSGWRQTHTEHPQAAGSTFWFVSIAQN